MIAVNASTSNMPRLLIVNVPPEMSAGCRRPARARSVSSLPPHGDLPKTRGVGAADDRGHDALLDGHRDGYMDIRVLHDSVRGPARVHPRVFAQGAPDSRNEEIRVRDANAVRFFDRREQSLSCGIEGTRIDVASQEEMRNGGPALGGALGHEASDRAEGLHRGGASPAKAGHYV